MHKEKQMCIRDRVSNALAAVAVGKLCGLNDKQLVKGVQAYKTVGSRANVINTADYKIIDDCYNRCV